MASEIVDWLEDLSQHHLSLALRDFSTATEHFGPLVPVFSPLCHPHLDLAVFAWADTPILVSFSTHSELPFLRPRRCILTCRHVTASCHLRPTVAAIRDGRPSA